MSKYMDEDDYDDDYDDYDYDDADDDWEAEAAREEEEQRAAEAARAALAEKKLGTRVPVKKEEEAEAEEAHVLPDDVKREVEQMRQVANDIASGDGLVKDSSVDLLADKPVATAEDAEKLGVLIAEHVLTFSDHANFKIVVDAFFQKLGGEFTTVKCLNERAGKVQVAAAEFKRQQKENKKKKDVVVEQHDSLGFSNVEDKGGATTEVDETPW